MIYAFPSTPDAPLASVGGKGRSLILMAARGLPVPPGLVLGVEFFAGWWEELRSSPEWTAFQAADATGLAAACEALKTLAEKCRFDQRQRQALEQALQGLQGETFLAVRSSSPEEDLQGSSFAGIYETLLGVARSELEGAVAGAFSSCLDHRVAVYKMEQGFDWRSPKIAVVVQELVPAEAAGVGFALDPVNNDYDVAVVTANFGLGETVVAGTVSPDTYRVDRVRQVILERQLGDKETSIFLSPSGGTEERVVSRKQEQVLTDPQVLEVARLVTRVADSYGAPMDIEWAFAEGRLFLLQARPITTHLSLPEAMVTAPGAPRRLYLDLTISVQGFLRPMSVLGTSCLSRFLKTATTQVLGRNLAEPDGSGLVLATAGRLYFNLANLFTLVPRDRFCSGFARIDPVAAQTLQLSELDPTRSANPDLKGLPLHLLWRLPDKLLAILEARLRPDSAYRRSQAAIAEHMRLMRSLAARDLPLEKLSDEVFDSTTRLVFKHMVPLLAMAQVARSKLAGLFSPEHAADVGQLDVALPGNLTVEMGLELYRLACLLPQGITREELERRLGQGHLDREFLDGWAAFLEEYGHRGPQELDIRSPRYREDPGMLLEQLVQLRAVPPGPGTPRAVYDGLQEARHEAYQRLGEAIHSRGWLQTQRFESLYQVLERLGGVRESGKFYLIYGLDLLRSRILAEARRLTEAGRLEAPEHAFDLALEDLFEAENLDLASRRRERLAFQASFERFRELPRVVDSRGRIYAPPPPEAREGEVVGNAVSSGVARGPVKVLNTPTEKPVHAGEILVARATDPGWTPLFVHAAAVVLEVGGILQHGALVAREYGKPCVVGVAGATGLWADGTWVEVDGSTGVIRTLDPDAAEGGSLQLVGPQRADEISGS
ncbi:MAG: PEP/pyruvate-binding domain-containing protein [Candidatus Eremiobacterota bacterium]